MTMRPCWVEIDTAALENNYQYLRGIAPAEVELMAVVKGDAYGHALRLCAPAAARAGARWLGVTSVEEGIAARALCPEAQVLIMSGCYRGEGAAVLQHRLTAVAWEPWQFDEMETAARGAGLPASSLPVHLEIDTGMSRQGVDLQGLAQILSRFDGGSRLRLEGVHTHLFAADQPDGVATDGQLACLEEALAQIAAARVADIAGKWLSVGSSAVLLSGESRRIGALAARFGMKALIRPGLALYGVAPDFDPPLVADRQPSQLVVARERLKPVLTWKTQVVGIRSVPAGAVVGYNGTFVATEPMRLALLAVGYADGLDRSLGNRFSLLVRGHRAPLAGRVSMDLAVLDVTEIDGVVPGDEVVILGTQGGETISAGAHAQATGTIPWEVFTRIAWRVPRVARDRE